MRWRRRHATVVIVLTIVGAAAIVAGSRIPRQVEGDGTLYGHLWCLGVKFDTGETLPVSSWPSGLHVERRPGVDVNGVLIDDHGAVILREGHRVRIHGTVQHGTGDTPCAYTELLTVTTFEALAPP